MDIFEAIKNAWQMITRTKARSFLTMLGIIIGISAVMIVLSVGESVQELILDEIRNVGPDLIAVLPGASDDGGPPSSAFGIINTSLKYEDGEAIIRSNYQYVHSLAMYLTGNDVISIDGKIKGIAFYGTTTSYTDVQNSKVESGRFFTKEEEVNNARVVVLGNKVAKEIFGDDNPIGQRVTIKKINFNVIGVLEEKGSSLIQSQDDDFFIPISTAQNIVLGVNYINFMRIKISDINNIDNAKEHVRSILRDRHNIRDLEQDDFMISSTADALETISLITDALKFFLTAVAAISLIVGGFGIMNIMLATVQERTKEIGLRRAIGAKKKEIVNQFLVEATTITFVSGVIGIIFGSLILVLISLIINSLDYNWTLIISPISVLLGCLVSIGIGLVFGITPAKRAAELNPIEALRYE